MQFRPFHELFPDVAARETRSVRVFPNSGLGLPAGEYGFLEMYCDERGCDCRRVFFYVVSELGKSVEAVVAWGWETKAFYREWLKYGDEKDVADLQGPILNLFSPQSKLAPAILNLVRDVLLKDASYVERIKRHYAMFRESIEGPMQGRQRDETRNPPRKRRKK